GSGRGGVGREIVFLTNTTPSARKEVASPIFLDARIHPSSVEEGNAHSISDLADLDRCASSGGESCSIQTQSASDCSALLLRCCRACREAQTPRGSFSESE